MVLYYRIQAALQILFCESSFAVLVGNKCEIHGDGKALMSIMRAIAAGIVAHDESDREKVIESVVNAIDRKQVVKK